VIVGSSAKSAHAAIPVAALTFAVLVGVKVWDVYDGAAHPVTITSIEEASSNLRTTHASPLSIQNIHRKTIKSS
jgi:hypothetical protein